jgi:hypothetical protein
MKIFELSDREKITHICPAPIGDVLLQRSADFSSMLHIFNRVFRDSHSLKKIPQFCPRFGAKTHQILEIAKWRQFDLSRPSGRVSPPIFSSERLLQR